MVVDHGSVTDSVSRAMNGPEQFWAIQRSRGQLTVVLDRGSVAAAAYQPL